MLSLTNNICWQSCKQQRKSESFTTQGHKECQVFSCLWCPDRSLWKWPIQWRCWCLNRFHFGVWGWLWKFTDFFQDLVIDKSHPQFWTKHYGKKMHLSTGVYGNWNYGLSTIVLKKEIGYLRRGVLYCCLLLCLPLSQAPECCKYIVFISVKLVCIYCYQCI